MRLLGWRNSFCDRDHRRWLAMRSHSRFYLGGHKAKLLEGQAPV